MKQPSREDYVDRRLNSQCSNFKFMNFLAMTYMTFLMASTVMGYKVVNIWGVSEPGSTLIYTFTFFLSNVYAELYGATYAKKLILQSIICGYLFAVIQQAKGTGDQHLMGPPKLSKNPYQTPSLFLKL